MRTALLSVILLSLLAGFPAYGAGFGAYFSVGGGATMWDTGNYSNKSNDTYVGGGILIDTAIARDKLFNYRVTLGMDSMTNRFVDGDFSLTEKGNIRGSLVNTFGFGVYRSDRFRVWLGPQVGFHLQYRETNPLRDAILLYTYGYYSPFYSYSYPSVTTGTVKQYDGVADFGLALGVNIHLTGYLSFIIAGGFRYGIHFGIKNLPAESVGHGYEGYVNIGLTYNYRDTYRGGGLMISGGSKYGGKTWARTRTK